MKRGISVSSMSKVFSLAGLRMGWIATHDGGACAPSSPTATITSSAAACLTMPSPPSPCASDAVLRRNQTIVRENLAILDACRCA